MKIDISPVPLDAIRNLRDLRRQELDCQFVLDSWPGRGWADSYLFRVNDSVVGYGCVGGVHAKRKVIVTEFYVLPVHRSAAQSLFRRFATVSGAKTIEVQTNDILLTLMLYDCAKRIKSDTVLFHDALTTNLTVEQGRFRKVAESDKERLFAHTKEPAGDWMIEAEGQAAATGGILFHYNIPYGDIYMEVAKPFRKRGYGSFLVQELKRTCYEMGRIPAARCSAANAASRATLQKAGLLPCARVLTGVISA